MLGVSQVKSFNPQKTVDSKEKSRELNEDIQSYLEEFDQDRKNRKMAIIHPKFLDLKQWGKYQSQISNE